MTPLSLLPTRKGPRLALLLLFLSGLFLWVLILQPIVHLLSAPAKRIANASRLLASYRAQSASLNALQVRLKELRARTAGNPGLVQGENASIAAAQIQSELKPMIESLNGAIRSTSVLPTMRDGHFETIAIRYDFSIPADKFSALLYRIETHVPYLTLGDIYITAPESQNLENLTPDLSLQVQSTVEAARLANPS